MGSRWYIKLTALLDLSLKALLIVILRKIFVSIYFLLMFTQDNATQFVKDILNTKLSHYMASFDIVIID